MAPVRNLPSGTTTFPPPSLAHAAMASAKAFVQLVCPSPAAPNFVTSNSFDGNCGGTIRFRIAGTADQGCCSMDSFPFGSVAKQLVAQSAAMTAEMTRGRKLLSACDDTVRD